MLLLLFNSNLPIYLQLEHDMENYVKWKLMGGKKFLKKNVIPHKFDCQVDRNRKFSSVPRESTIKRKRKEIIKVAEQELVTARLEEQGNVADATVHLQENVADTTVHQVQENTVDFRNSIEKAIQVNLKPHYRSKSVQCQLLKDLLTDSACSPFAPKHQHSVATSPIKPIKSILRNVKRKLDVSETSESSSDTEYCNSEYEALNSSDESGTSSEEIFISDQQSQEMRKIALHHTSYIILQNTRRYLGVPKYCSFVIDLLQKYTCLNTMNIYLTLKKIRLAQTFAELADDFGITECAASRIFGVSVIPISKVLQDLIVWPAEEEVKRNLPIPFRARYGKVQSIIDCLEVEIQKPSDAVKQALTWSEYKKANTLKYLVSATPDGIVNFISSGYGGRTSDAVIVEECGFLDKLKPGNHIMADRGFKHIDKLVREKQCTLVRPPSVETGKRMSEEQVLQTKKKC